MVDGHAITKTDRDFVVELVYRKTQSNSFDKIRTIKNIIYNLSLKTQILYNYLFSCNKTSNYTSIKIVFVISPMDKFLDFIKTDMQISKIRNSILW